MRAFRILVEFSKHFLVERYHEFTQEGTLGISTVTGRWIIISECLQCVRLEHI